MHLGYNRLYPLTSHQITSLGGGGIFTAKIPLNFLTSTVNSSGTLDAFSAALRTRRLLATFLVILLTTLFSFAALSFFLLVGRTAAFLGGGGGGRACGVCGCVRVRVCVCVCVCVVYSLSKQYHRQYTSKALVFFPWKPGVVYPHCVTFTYTCTCVPYLQYPSDTR